MDQDYTLTIDDVVKRLGKSVRTVHRYKDSKRLSYRIGPGKGRPLYFSEREVQGLAEELNPQLRHLKGQYESEFFDRLERVERLVGVLERNPLLEALMLQSGALAAGGGKALGESLQRLGGAPGTLGRKELGQLLIEIGHRLLEDG